MSNEKRISQLLDEIKEQDIRLNKQAEKIRHIELELQKTKEENDYLKSPLHCDQIISGVQEEYSNLLNPKIEPIETTYGGYRRTYDVDVNKIICIKALGKYKKIYFSKHQKSIEYQQLMVPDILFTGNFEELLEIINPQKVHFCQISKTYIVNVQYYNRSGSRVTLSDKFGTIEETKSDIVDIQLNKSYYTEFNERKKQYDALTWWTKNEFRSFNKI
jgi:hypothetical protein